MRKKFHLSQVWLLVLVDLVISIAVVYSFSLPAWEAKQALDDYEKAAYCSDALTCKQKVQAKVLSEQASLAYRKKSGKGQTTGMEILVSGYTISFVLSDGTTKSAAIIPNAPVKAEDFAFDDVYILHQRDPYFASFNFPKDKIVALEIWHGQVTMIFTDSIQGYFLSRPDIYTDPAKEISIPTEQHPRIIWAYESLQANMALFFSIIIMATLIFIAVRKSRFSFFRRQYAIPH